MCDGAVGLVYRLDRTPGGMLGMVLGGLGLGLGLGLVGRVWVGAIVKAQLSSDMRHESI